MRREGERTIRAGDDLACSKEKSNWHSITYGANNRAVLCMVRAVLLQEHTVQVCMDRLVLLKYLVIIDRFGPIHQVQQHSKRSRGY